MAQLRMLQYDNANLYAWMCIVQNLEFVLIISDRGLSFSLNVYITMQILYLNIPYKCGRAQ